ncbi:polymeric immunoglobulin receptor-like [Channa argus]|uniref:polymeric immunoglobulin receptor-like n=1 Tax=Channa argus TaxID=215402 RepID=UPI003521B030
MKIHLVFLLCLLAALSGENTGIVKAEVNIFTGAEGRSGTIEWTQLVSGSTKFFCKEDCSKDEDILVKTDNVTAKNGRYSIEYRNGPSGFGILSVTFTSLTKSDSGRYRCGLGKSLVPDSYVDFDIRVSNAPLGLTSGFIPTNTEGETVTYPCNTAVNNGPMFFCKDPCNKAEDILIKVNNVKAQNGRYGIEYINGSTVGLYVTIVQVTKSDTGWYTCGYGDPLSPASNFRFAILIEDASDAPITNFCWPWVLCSFLASVLLLNVCLLLLYKWKRRWNLRRNISGRTDGTNSTISVIYEN